MSLKGSPLSFFKELHSSLILTNSQDSSLWAKLIQGYVHNKSYRNAVQVFAEKQGLKLKAFADAIVPLLLKASAALSLCSHGRSLHSDALKSGTIPNLFIQTALIDIYAKCNVLSDARKVFDEMTERSIITWNAMLGGYAKNGDMGSAWQLFESMPARSSVSWTEMIDGYARIGETKTARRLFDQMGEEKTVVTWTAMVNGYVKNGEIEAAREVFEVMPERNFFSWSSMIFGYCKVGDVKAAKSLFSQMKEKNLVNWNTLLSGLTQNGWCEEALEVFNAMCDLGVKLDEVTVACALSASAQLGSLETGRDMHLLIEQKGIRVNKFVSNASIDMYAKCGDISKARELFTSAIEKNEVCCNSMISGVASHGHVDEALELFTKMRSQQVKPNGLTFLAILSARAHAGYVQEGMEFFASMLKGSEVVAGVEHYGCMVDLLGHAGLVGEAYEVIKSICP